MSVFIKPARVRRAIAALSNWRDSANMQPSVHLWQVLALLRKGVNTREFVQYEEADDFRFWDDYNRSPDAPDDAAKSDRNVYFSPLTRKLHHGDYPHNTIATIRKERFSKWGAAEDRNHEGQTEWRLSNNFDEVVQQKLLVKKRTVHRVPVVDLAVWLFRIEEFDDGSDARSLESRFREVFPLTDEQYDRLFVFRDEDAGEIFTQTKPPLDAYKEAVRDTIIPDKVDVPPPPADESAPVELVIEDDDPVLTDVEELLTLGSSGIILSGCPGTSKTWYAKQIAMKLTAGDASSVYQVQFHPSYGYEDFIEGYRPDDNKQSGFDVVDRVFLDACSRAAEAPSSRIVFIIDEINRGDPARIFGELLTYIEADYRGQNFTLPYSGDKRAIPGNLTILATMNPFDRSITQLDQALLRRFDHIQLEPSGEVVSTFLEATGEFGSEQVDIVRDWFEGMQELLVHGGVGHTYFRHVKTPESLETIWRHRIRPSCEALLEHEPGRMETVDMRFHAMYRRLLGQDTETGDNG